MGFLRDLVDDLISFFNIGANSRPTLSDVMFDGPRTLAAAESGDFSVSFKINPSKTPIIGVTQGEYEILLMVDEERAFPRGGLIQSDTTQWRNETVVMDLFRIAWDSDQVERIDWLIRIQSATGRVFDSRRGVFAVSIKAL